VADRLLLDLEAEGLVKIAVWPWGGSPQIIMSRPLAWPLDEAVLEDLRWYLEDYLRAPFGVWEDRGPRVASQLMVLGSIGEHSARGLFWCSSGYRGWCRSRSQPGHVSLPSATLWTAPGNLEALVCRIRLCYQGVLLSVVVFLEFFRGNIATG
jgi:hypothetical protein